jgi:glycosyltransferase involved in cell wall biosynthesis
MSTGPRLRILIVTKVFPNALEPVAAAFNRQQFAALGRLATVHLMAVVQWFPGAGLFPSRTTAGKLSRLPAYEWIDGLFVRHPRVFHVPRLDYAVAPALYVASLWPAVRRLAGKVDVVLGSFAYPDGVAAVALARLLGVPSAIYALGTDLNVVPAFAGVPAVLRRALPRAQKIIAPSRALGDRAVALGASPDRVVVIPNGVDRSIFFPQDRRAMRRFLGQPEDGRWILFVGRLEKEKGLEELLAAFQKIAAAEPDLKLVVVGDGTLRARLQGEAARTPGRIIVAGPRPLSQVGRWMAAADLLALPSWNEGTPNVVLEALASGRRVVATRVGGIPDVITSDDCGELCEPRDVDGLAASLRRVAGASYDPAALAARATVTWDESAARLHDVLASAAARNVS